MVVLVAMDSFKGSCTAHDAGEAVCRGILRAMPEAEVRNVPVADGGEGTVEAIIGGGRGRHVLCEVSGPMGEKVEAGYGVLSNGTAIIEMSAASGLLLVEKQRANPLVATTYGTGELIRHALDAGYRRLLIGLGGSATNDGGAGMAQALGAKLLDGEGRELVPGGAALGLLCAIDMSGFDPRIADCEIICAVDVVNPLCGEMGASAIYGPQKGATPEMVRELDNALRHYAETIKRELGSDVLDLPGAGAAGGLGAGMYAFCGARFQPGIEAVLDIVGFDESVRDADLVITGEGRMDGQTVNGKVPVGVAKRAKAQGHVPVLALVGAIGPGASAVYDHGIDGAYSIADGPMTLEQSCERVEELLERSSEALGRTVAAIARANGH